MDKKKIAAHLADLAESAQQQVPESDLQQLKALALAATNAQTVSEQGAALAAFEHAMSLTSPAVVLDLIARIDALEDGFKLALGSLALKDHDEAERIGKQYRQQVARIERAAAPAPARFTQDQIVAAARALSDRSATACNVNKLDNWDIYGGEFIDDARAALEAAGASAASPATASGNELPPLPEPIEVGGEGWDFEDFKSWKTFTVEHMEDYARAAVSAATKPTADLIPVPRAVLEKISDAMNHMGDQLNEIDAVEEEDEAICTPAFEAVQSLLATKPAAAPQGWRDALRRSGANTDYHGLVAFTGAQLENFVSMLAAAPMASADAVIGALTRNECDLALRWLDVTRLYAFVEPEDDALADKLNKIRAGAEGAAS